VKWLQNNLPGIILASACGFLVLVAILIAIVGARPAAPGDVVASDLNLDLEQRAAPVELKPLGQYRVVTDRPLFNESRRPVIEIAENDQPEVEEQLQAGVTDAPEVNLTGVVITPEVKLVSLTPAKGGEPLVFGEGRPMHGDYNGWVVSEVWPRSAVLESRDGRRVELALQVNDELIKEPPKPVLPKAKGDEPVDADADGENDERLSRAEEIRQRIAERREQLRQEAAENEAAEANNEPEGEGVSPYAQAIRNMMSQGKSKSNQKSDDDEE
jgi:hypothetical protein